MTDSDLLKSIEDRVRPTICETFDSHGGMTVEGRILKTDFDALIDLMARMAASERERCAQLHEQINPASDDERHHHCPGAGAMGAVIEYRDKIRALT